MLFGAMFPIAGWRQTHQSVPPGVASVSIDQMEVLVTADGTLTQQFTATARDANGAVVPGQTFTWAIVAGGTGSGTISGAGVLTGSARGTITVKATTSGISGTLPGAVYTPITTAQDPDTVIGASTNGFFMLMPGTHLRRQINQPGNGTNIYISDGAIMSGYAAGQTVVTAAATSYMVRHNTGANGPNNITFRGSGTRGSMGVVKGYRSSATAAGDNPHDGVFQIGQNDNHGSGWLLEGFEMTDCWGAGIMTGDNQIIRRLYLHHIEVNGIKCPALTNGVYSDGATIEDNRIEFINFNDNHALEDDTAGMKLAAGNHNFTVRRNIVKYCHSQGIWFDIDCVNMKIGGVDFASRGDGNLVEYCYGQALEIEICYGGANFAGKIIGNTARFCGTQKPPTSGARGSQIFLSTCGGVEVAWNYVDCSIDPSDPTPPSRSSQGILVINESRGNVGATGAWPAGVTAKQALDLYIHDNIIRGVNPNVYMAAGVVQNGGPGSPFDASRNITFASNSYCVDSGAQWAWDGSIAKTFAQWQAAGMDTSAQGSIRLTALFSWAVGQRLDDATFARSTTATYKDEFGARQTAAINVARLDAYPMGNRRLQLEDTATMYFANSGAPATQTFTNMPAGTYTLWLEGTGSIAVSGAIDGAYGSASEGSYLSFTVTALQNVTFTKTGTVTIAQCEDSPFPTSYFPTTTVPATRGNDKLDFSFSGITPQASTTFLSVEVGGYDARAATRRFTFVGVPGTTVNRYTIQQSTGNGYQAPYNNGIASSTPTLPVGSRPGMGDQVDIIFQLASDGTPTISQSKNDGAVSTGTQTAQALPANWGASPKISIGGGSGSPTLSAGYRDLLVVQGVQTIATMQKFRTPI